MLRIGEILAVTLVPAAVAGIIVWCFVPRQMDAGGADGSDARTSAKRWCSLALATAICVATTVGYLAFDIQSRVVASQSGYGAKLQSRSAAWQQAVISVGNSLLRPTEARQRIPQLAVATIVAVAVIGWAPRLGALARWLFVCSFCGMLAARQLWTSVYMTLTWDRGEAVFWLTILGIVGGTLWWCFVPPSDERGRFDHWGWLYSALVAGLIAISLASSGSVTYGALAAGWTSSLTGGWMAAIAGGRVTDRIGWSGPVATFGFLMLLLGYCFAELTATSGLLLMASLYGIALSLRAVCGDRFRRTVLTLSLLPALLAAGLAIRQAMKETALPDPYAWAPVPVDGSRRNEAEVTVFSFDTITACGPSSVATTFRCQTPDQ